MNMAEVRKLFPILRPRSERASARLFGQRSDLTKACSGNRGD